MGEKKGGRKKRAKKGMDLQKGENKLKRLKKIGKKRTKKVKSKNKK